MFSNKCTDCPEFRRCKESAASTVFFIIGLVAIIAVRAVTILEHIKPIYGKMAWYLGILGFVIYFAYKFKVDNNRVKLIKERGLMSKISNGDAIEKEDRIAISSILCALSSGMDRINYLVIFASSAVVLILTMYLDFFR